MPLNRIVSFLISQYNANLVIVYHVALAIVERICVTSTVICNTVFEVIDYYYCYYFMVFVGFIWDNKNSLKSVLKKKKKNDKS